MILSIAYATFTTSLFIISTLFYYLFVGYMYIETKKVKKTAPLYIKALYLLMMLSYFLFVTSIWVMICAFMVHSYKTF